MRDLVLLPGWGMSPAVFAGLEPLLAPHFRLTLLPLPAGATLDAMADRALAAAPPSALWLGWSLGGMVAVRAALRAPARVAGLVPVGTNLRFVAAPDWPSAMPADDFHAFSAMVAADLPAAHARFCALATRGAPTARDDLRRLRLLAPVPDDALAARQALAVLQAADLRDDVRHIACAQCWLFGAHDALVPAAAATDVRRLLAAGSHTARVELLSDAAHVPFLSCPALVVDALARCLPEYA